MFRFWSLSLAIGLGVMLTTAASAQLVRNRNQQVQPRPGGQPQVQQQAQVQRQVVAPRPTSANPDAMLSHCLIVDNRGEIELAQFALQHSQNAEVKQFAQMLIDDHSKMLASLERIGGGQATQPASNTVAGNVDRRNSIVPGAANAPFAPAPTAAPGGLDFAALKEELGQQCLKTAKDELGQKQGAEFDKCYIGSQIGAHKHAFDTMMVFDNHAGPELQSVLDDGLLVVQTHWDHAKDLMKKLEGSASSQAAERTATEQSRR